jgi:predicted permease
LKKPEEGLLMRVVEKLRLRLMTLFHRRREAERLDAELRFHLENQIAENVAMGMDPEDARLAAMRQFGNPTVFRQQVREMWSWTWLEHLLQDVRYALRRLWHSPGFVLVTVLTLALGIGANTAIFTLMNALLLRSLPVADPGRLARIGMTSDVPNADHYGGPLNLLIIQSIERKAHSFSGIFGWCDYGVDLKESDAQRSYPGAIVSGNAFDVLGVHPAIGRMLKLVDDQPGGGPDGWTTVISYQFWIEHYNADPSVVGRHVTLSGYSVTIVGVAPASFAGILATSRPDFYIPLHYEPVMRQRQRDSMLYKPGYVWLTTMGRLNPGVTLGAASAEIAALTHTIVEETFPADMRSAMGLSHLRLTVFPGRAGWSWMRLRYTQPLLLIQMLVATVLLVCCANLAGLGLARASARQQEFALRVALGAERMRMLRQMLLESFLLAVPGALLGLGFAWIACRVLLRLLASGSDKLPTAISIRPDMTVLAVTAACAILCAVLSGIAPAWTASRTAPEPALRRAAKGSVHGENSGLRQCFVCIQIGLSLTLAVVAGLLSATFINLRLGSTGFRTANVSVVMADLRLLPERGPALTHIYWRMAERLKEMPGVLDVSLATVPPLVGYMYTPFSVVDSQTHSGETKQPLGFNEVGAHFFATFGVPIQAGRDFANVDTDANTCIVSQSAAAKLFPHTPVIGATLRQYQLSGDSGKASTNECQVIGIVGDAKFQDLRTPPSPTVYRPIAPDMPNPGLMNFVIYARSFGEAKDAYRRTLHEIVPGSSELEMTPIKVQIDNSVSIERLLASLSGFFAGLALLLSGIGIYSLIAWSVTRRRIEFGVRIALGATNPRIVLLVLRQIASLIVIGIVAGGIAGFFSARAIRSFLFGVAPGSPAIFLSAAVGLCVIALLAALPPVRRAVTIDPAESLRAD